MTPETIIEQVTADGVSLEVTSKGTIKASGKQGAVDRWLPILLEHKAGIVAALQSAKALLLVPGTQITWTRSDLTLQHGTVQFVHVDGDGQTWAFVTIGKSWAAVNTRYVTKTEAGQAR